MFDCFVGVLSGSGMEQFHFQMAAMDQHSPPYNDSPPTYMYSSLIDWDTLKDDVS